MKSLIYTLFALLLTVLVVSCDKGSEKLGKPGDYGLVDVLVSIKDAENNDLLNSSNPNNILSKIELTYENKLYKLDTSPFTFPNPISEIFGLHLYIKESANLLWFGYMTFEETGTRDLKLKYSERVAVISVKYDTTTKKTTFFVNGTEVSGSIVLVL